MSKYNDSSAVQYERFPVERVQYQERPELEVLPQQKAGTGSKKAAFPYGKYAAIFSCVFAVLFCIVASYMRLAEIHTQNAKLEKEMKEAAKMLEFELAAALRDQIIELRGETQKKK